MDTFTTYIVDDDPSVLKALDRVLRGAGYETRPYSSSRDFLANHNPVLAGCAILDVSMPDFDGLTLQNLLTEQGADRPIIFLTGIGDIPTSVRAMRAGAIDFLTKPIQREMLLSAVHRACEHDAVLRQERETYNNVDEKLRKLTPREREVLTHVVAGRLNKQIAADLGTVEKTIKVHRSRMMQKMGVRTVADLVRMIERTGALEHPRNISTGRS
jgi:FixJ family two-component response regulator